MDTESIAAASRPANPFAFADNTRGQAMRLTFDIAEPEALLRFLDAAQPSAGFLIPQDVVTIADAIEAHLAVSATPAA